MSTNFTGVTFANQKITPSDDAVVRRAILPDGILAGCELSYSGSTLTMAAGQIIACGRQIKHPSAQNWAVADATSGYARLLLTIDLTRTSTKDSFDQVVDEIEYASSKDGFVDLEQSDINLSGTRYQIEVCVVSLGTGGITGIVSQLEQSRAEGGGLNFSVVGGVTQPSDPKENTIWVNTSNTITSYIFSATAPPTPAEGMVWITVGTSGSVEFNALKKNAIQIYPLSAFQYVGGAWVSVTAEIYQDGEWKQLLDDIYVNGSIMKDYHFQLSSSGASGVVNANSIILSAANAFAYVVFEGVDLTDVTSLEATLNVRIDMNGTTEGTATGYLFIADAKGATYSSAAAVVSHVATGATNDHPEGDTMISLDVSSFSGKYYVYVGTQYGSTSYARICELKKLLVNK